MARFLGASKGETGNYGIGEIVEGSEYEATPGGWEVDGEPVYLVYQLVDAQIVPIHNGWDRVEA